MSSCCDPLEQTQTGICPQDGSRGHAVSLITLKSLLKPTALPRLDPQVIYRFCPGSECAVVYFSGPAQVFTQADLKVPVAQKDLGERVPLCYCFGWNRERIRERIAQGQGDQVIEFIQTQIRADRCGCEVNNPQGRCCLAGIRSLIKGNLL